MASRPGKPSAPAKRDPDDAFGAVLEQLQALRRELSELRDEVRAMGQRRRAPRRERPGLDPGDAVPPGVAVQDPAPLTADDREAKRGLERLPKRR